MACGVPGGPGLLGAGGEGVVNLTAEGVPPALCTQRVPVRLPGKTTWGLTSPILRGTPSQLLGTGQDVGSLNPPGDSVWPQLSRGAGGKTRKSGPAFSPEPFCYWWRPASDPVVIPRRPHTRGLWVYRDGASIHGRPSWRQRPEAGWPCLRAWGSSVCCVPHQVLGTAEGPLRPPASLGVGGFPGVLWTP